MRIKLFYLVASVGAIVVLLKAFSVSSKAGYHASAQSEATGFSKLFSGPVHRYEYVCPDGHVYIYDVDHGFSLVKTIAVPTSAGTRGVVASAVTGMLYISYGGDGLTTGSMLKYDLTKNQVVWTKAYPFGIDSMAISPDGKTIYMPTGELTDNGLWKVLDAASGDVTGEINSRGLGPYNTVVSADGTHVYLGLRSTNNLIQVDTSSHQIFREIGPVTTGIKGPGVRSFTINGAETLAFITVTGTLGFQVGDIATGKVLYNVPIDGFSWDGSGDMNSPSNGISISPDDKELYVMDAPNSSVHVYDITSLPASAPKQIANIRLAHQVIGKEEPCAYDCAKGGWLHHSRDGRYVFVGDAGDVIDTTTRKTVAVLPTLANTRNFIEVDLQGNEPAWAMVNRSSISNRRPLAPLPDGEYKISNGSTHFVLDDPFSSKAPGQQIIQWGWNNGVNQKWRFVSHGNGYYTIQNLLSGLFLTDPGGPLGQKIPLQQQAAKKDDSQLWSLHRTGGSTFVITNKARQLVVHDPASNPVEGTGLVLSQSDPKDQHCRWSID